MKEQLTKLLTTIKEFWKKQTPKFRKIVKVSGIGIVVLAVVLTVALNVSKSQYKTLFPGMSSEETVQVSAAIKDMEYTVDVKFDSNGNIMVPSSQYDKVKLDLAAMDFPKSTLSYDIFLNNSLTSTDFEKRQALVFQLESDIQYNLTHGIEGVKSASVKLNIPQENTHVWEQSSPNTASAAIIMTMDAGYTLSSSRVSAIKNIVAAGLPNMLPENVKVVDGATGVEIQSANSGEAGVYNMERLQYERQIAQALEDSARRILAPSYGAENIAVVASVVLDYDKMLTQETQKLTKDDGSGYLTHDDENYQVNGQISAGDLVGEANNTDTPTYLQNEPTDENGVTNYGRGRDFEYGELRRQTEKTGAVLKNSSIAITINTTALSDQKKAELVDQISKATGINNLSDISIGLMDPYATDVITPPIVDVKQWYETIPIYFWLVPVLVIFLLVFVLILIRKGHKKKVAEAEQESEALINSLQAEIEDRKKQIAEAAQAESNPGDGAIVQEVRNFAKENPEITANLIRSWLKEDQ